jgi:TolB-like protein
MGSEGLNTMRTKGLAVQSILEVAENRAKQCPISGHLPSSRLHIGSVNHALDCWTAASSQDANAPSTEKRLGSWKEVASYLRCNVRTVQRWERSEGLPLHRHFHQTGSTVYAFSGELDAWLDTRSLVRSSPSTAPKRSNALERLLVLPFVNLGHDMYFNLLCDGLTEEINFQLASLDPQRFALVARAASMSQETPPKTISEIGRNLRVTSVMEGCLRSSGRRIRLTARLIRVSDQTQIWTQCFDGEVSDPLQFQLETATRVLQSLPRSGVFPEANLPLPVAPTIPSQPVDHFQTADSNMQESPDKRRKPNSHSPKGTFQSPAGKAPLLGFAALLYPPKELCTQAQAQSSPS